jgi:predicted MPP superfamily phosphohydrolase
MSRFLYFLIAVTVLIHVPFALGTLFVARRLELPSPVPLALTLTAALTFFFIGRARAGMPDRRRSGFMVWCVDVPYYVHWCACLFTLIPSVVATAVVPLVDLGRGLPVGLPHALYASVYALGLVVCGYGILVRRRWVVVREHDIVVEGLDSRLDGYRIAHFSDLHIGALTPRAWGMRWVRKLEGRHVDLAVVTGDLITSGTEFHHDVAEVIGALRVPDGVFVSFGNHDYFGEGEPLLSKIRDVGAHVLRNQGVLIERRGAKFFLAAIDDTWTRRDDLTAALRERPEGMPTVLLAHDPERFRAAAKLGVDLTLSGHTHGGQIAMPFFSRRLSLSHLTHHFHVGFYRKGRSLLYVSPGLGTTGPPMRLGAAPTIAIHTLRASRS